jgi:hypothetical protein
MGANLEDLEQCFECFSIKDDDTSPEDEFEVSDVSKEERITINGENEYLRDLINSNGLEILKKDLVQRPYEDRNENEYSIYFSINHVWKVYNMYGQMLSY